MIKKGTLGILKVTGSKLSHRQPFQQGYIGQWLAVVGRRLAVRDHLVVFISVTMMLLASHIMELIPLCEAFAEIVKGILQPADCADLVCRLNF